MSGLLQVFEFFCRELFGVMGHIEIKGPGIEHVTYIVIHEAGIEGGRGGVHVSQMGSFGTCTQEVCQAFPIPEENGCTFHPGLSHPGFSREEDKDVLLFKIGQGQHAGDASSILPDQKTGFGVEVSLKAITEFPKIGEILCFD